MSGRWTLIGEGRKGSPGRFSHGAVIGSGDGPHDWVVAHLDDGGRRYSDHRRFGIMDCFSTENQLENRFISILGPGRHQTASHRWIWQNHSEGEELQSSPLLDQR